MEEYGLRVAHSKQKQCIYVHASVWLEQDRRLHLGLGDRGQTAGLILWGMQALLGNHGRWVAVTFLLPPLHVGLLRPTPCGFKVQKGRRCSA